MLKDTEKSKNIRSKIVYWLVFNLGALMLAVGTVLFKNPRRFVTGGVSGISILLNEYIPFLGTSEIALIINILLLIVGFIFLGKGCTFKTAYCSIVYSLEMWLIEKCIPAEVFPLTDDKFMEFCYAMLLTGAGSAIIFNCHASSGGTDIIALIIKKKKKTNSLGVSLLISDLIIACIPFFIMDVETGLFSVLGLFAKSFLVDGVIENISTNKFVTIITSKPEDIMHFILDGIHRGYTSYKATGGYTGEEKTIIITVCNRREALKLKIKIHFASTEAFVILTDTHDILGKGFRDTI